MVLYQFELKVDLLDTLYNCPWNGTVRKLLELEDNTLIIIYMVNNWLLIFPGFCIKLFVFNFQIAIACFKCMLQLGFLRIS